MYVCVCVSICIYTYGTKTWREKPRVLFSRPLFDPYPVDPIPAVSPSPEASEYLCTKDTTLDVMSGSCGC